MDILLFDVDNTLYPKECGLFKEVDKRINLYIKKYLNIKDLSQINLLRKKYFYKYGTTLNGLMKHHNVDPIHYLEFVHDVPLENYISKNQRLKNFLLATRINQKIIFSNAYKPYIYKILDLLEIRDCFKEIFDIVELNYNPKPLLEPYLNICEKFGTEPKKFIMIDDSEQNLLTAKNLGMKTVYIKNYRKENKNFDINLEKVEELEKYIDF